MVMFHSFFLCLPGRVTINHYPFFTIHSPLLTIKSYKITNLKNHHSPSSGHLRVQRCQCPLVPLGSSAPGFSTMMMIQNDPSMGKWWENDDPSKPFFWTVFFWQKKIRTFFWENDPSKPLIFLAQFSDKAIIPNIFLMAVAHHWLHRRWPVWPAKVPRCCEWTPPIQPVNSTIHYGNIMGIYIYIYIHIVRI